MVTVGMVSCLVKLSSDGSAVRWLRWCVTVRPRPESRRGKRRGSYGVCVECWVFGLVVWDGGLGRWFEAM